MPPFSDHHHFFIGESGQVHDLKLDLVPIVGGIMTVATTPQSKTV